MSRNFQAPLRFLFCILFVYLSWEARSVTLNGTILDEKTRKPIAARLYIQDQKGNWFFPSATGKGSAIPYKKNPAPTSLEMHTTLSADPFTIDLPPGDYTITVERGKEYIPLVRHLFLSDTDLQTTFHLSRWIHMAERGWFSGDTHTHRTMEELPNLVLAEDVHVTHPMNYWTMNAFESPKESARSVKQTYAAKAIAVDPYHVIYPVNTEYELFQLNGKPHTLGAILLLNHKNVLDLGAPPIRAIADKVHQEGGVIAFDKHNWEWSLMLPPIARNDLFDLANNHMWRTEFRFKDWGVPAPAYMKITPDESGWIHYGFQTYYALLNAGFKMMATGGTGAGFHPAPFGFGRVYVQCPAGFTYERWMEGLKRGNSFVTTGPMLFVTGNGRAPGSSFTVNKGDSLKIKLKGDVEFLEPMSRVEIVVNGVLHATIRAANHRNRSQAFVTAFASDVTFSESGWVVVRAVQERPQGGLRFAHSSPFFVNVPDKPLRPRPEELNFLVGRVQAEIKRNAGVLPESALQEYQEALRYYEKLLPLP